MQLPFRVLCLSLKYRICIKMALIKKVLLFVSCTKLEKPNSKRKTQTKIKYTKNFGPIRAVAHHFQGASVVSALLAHGSVARVTEDAVATRTFPASEKFFVHLNERDVIEACTPGQITLQWAPQGRLFFLLGMVGSTLAKLGVSIKSLIS